MATVFRSTTRCRTRGFGGGPFDDIAPVREAIGRNGPGCSSLRLTKSQRSYHSDPRVPESSRLQQAFRQSDATENGSADARALTGTS